MNVNNAHFEQQSEKIPTKNGNEALCVAETTAVPLLKCYGNFGNFEM